MANELDFFNEADLEDEIDRGPSLEEEDAIDDHREDITEENSLDFFNSASIDGSQKPAEPGAPPLSDVEKLKQAESEQLGNTARFGSIGAEAQKRAKFLKESTSIPEIVSDRALDIITGEERLTEASRGRPELIELLTSSEMGRTVGGVDKSVDIDLSKWTTEEQRSQLSKALAFSASTDEMVAVMKDVFPQADIREDKQGTVIMTIEGERILLNRPGLSTQDLQENLFDAVSLMNLNPIAGLYKSAVKRIGSSFALEAGLDVTKQLLSGKEEVDYLQATATGVFGTVPDLFALRKAKKLNKKIRQQFKEDSLWKRIKGSVKAGSPKPLLDAAPETVIAAERNLIQSQKFEERIGKQILNPIQEMLDPTDIATVSGVARAFPQEVTEKVKQNFLKDVPETAEQFVRAFSDVEQRSKAPKAVRRAVEDHTRDFWKKFSKVSSKMYKGVRNDPTKISIAPAVQNLLEALQDGNVLKGSPTWNAVVGHLKVFNKAKTVGEFHTAKVALEKGLRRLNMEIPADKHVAGVLGEFKNGLTDILSAASEPYANATRRFKNVMVPIREEFQQGLTSKLASIPYKKKGEIVAKMFADGAKNPAQLAKTRKVLDAVDPELFKDALANNIDNRIAKVDIPELLSDDLADVARVPKRIKRAILGSPAEQTAIKKVLKPEEKETFDLFVGALNSLERGWGKNVAGEIRKGFSGASLANAEKVSLLKKIFTAISTPALVSTVSPSLGMASAIGTSSRVTRDILKSQMGKAEIKRLRAFKDMMFNPKYRNELSRIRKVGLNNPSGLRSFLKLVTGVEDNTELETVPDVRSNR